MLPSLKSTRICFGMHLILRLSLGILLAQLRSKLYSRKCKYHDLWYTECPDSSVWGSLNWWTGSLTSPGLECALEIVDITVPPLVFAQPCWVAQFAALIFAQCNNQEEMRVNFYYAFSVLFPMPQIQLTTFSDPCQFQSISLGYFL